MKHQINEQNFSQEHAQNKHHSRKHDDFDYAQKRKSIRVRNHETVNHPKNDSEVMFKEHVEVEKPQRGINKSSGNIQFESNDLLDDYKK